MVVESPNMPTETRGRKAQSLPLRLRIRSLLSQRVVVLASMAFLVAVYTVLAGNMSALRSLSIADTSARFAMIRNWIDHGNLVFLRNDFSALDPSWQYHPLGLLDKYHALTGVMVDLPHGHCTVYPPLFVLLSGIAYRLVGWGGLYVLPVFCGLGAVVATYAISCRLGLRSAPAVPLVMGLATPIVVYSAMFWDHSLHMMLVAGAAYLLLRALQRQDARAALVAGLLLGLGVWFHELFILLFGAFLVASVPILRAANRRRLVFAMAAGFSGILGLWLVGNLLIYGRLAGAHFSGMSNLSHAGFFRQVISPAGVAMRAREQIIGLKDGNLTDLPFFALLLAYATSSWFGRRSLWVAPVAWVLCGIMAVALLIGSPYACGLLQVTPLLVASVAHPSGFGKRADRRPLSPEEVFLRWLWSGTLIFVAAVLLSPQDPGNIWGSRYLLTALPLLLVLSAAAMERQMLAMTKIWRPVGMIGVMLLVGLSCFSQVHGCVLSWQQAYYYRCLNNVVQRYGGQVLVSRQADMTINLEAQQSRPVLLARYWFEVPGLLNTLERAGVQDFSYVGDKEGIRDVEYFARHRGHPFVRVETRGAGLLVRFRQGGDSTTRQPPARF